MRWIKTLDGENRARLLCHLVVSQLIAFAETGEWLRTDHFVESQRIWLTAKSLAAHWTEGVRLRPVSIELASSIWAIELLRDGKELALLFDDALQLDYKSVIVRAIHDICAARLETWLFEK